MNNLLVLFDGNAIVHRAFHAIQPLTVARTGEMVNAVHGFVATFLKVLREQRPTHWGIAFDRPVPTFRHQMFEKYKEQRPPTPEELKSQIQRVHQVAKAFSIPIFEKDGFEADDVLATISQQASSSGIDTVIVTGDNDMLQLVSPRIRVLYPKRSFSDPELLDETGVREKYGLDPAQIADYKALVGDKSDNIPGVNGIGEKTAARLLQQFGSITAIYESLDKVSPARLQAILETNREQALKSRQLATVIREVPGITFDPAACTVTRYDREAVSALFRELEFISLLSRLPQDIGAAETAPAVRTAPTSARIVNTPAALDELASSLTASQQFVIDVFTSDKSAMTADLIGLVIALKPGEAFYLPLAHRGLEQPPQLPVETVMAKLGPVMESPAVRKISGNGKAALLSLSRCGIRLDGLAFDTSIAAYLLGEKTTAVASLAFNRFGFEPPSAIGTGGKTISPALLPAPEMASYAAFLADMALRLEPVMMAELAQKNLIVLFNDIEMPLVPVLAEMEKNGVALDTALLRQLSEGMEAEINRLQKDIYQLAAMEFNINSPQQLGKVLFERLQIPAPKRTKSGYSTDASVLEGLHDYPVVRLVLDYRQLTKLKSTYLDALPALVNPQTHRIHSSFNQAVTTTGRLSSSDPNLQNIPIRTETGRKIRQAIIAAPGFNLLAADYSQIDLRVLAHLSQDPVLVNAFLNNEDIHTSTAAQVFNVSPSQVTADMRRVAKTVNFGVIYGMSDYGLEQATDLSREESAGFIDTYFKRYPGVKEYLDRTRAQAREQGYVQTLTGRRRYIPEINSPNRQVREAAERMAINMPVQGTSADIIKIAMVRLHRVMGEKPFSSRLILQVHDELVFEAASAETDTLARLLDEVMPRAMTLTVPLKIDIKLGANWGEMKLWKG